MASAKTVIAVVEAAYDLEGSERAWLERICRAAAPLLDRGLGLISYGYDVRAMPLAVSNVVYHGVPRKIRGVFRRINTLVGSDEVANTYGRGLSCLTARQSVDVLPEWAEAQFASAGIYDVIGINAAEPDGTGVMLTAAAPSSWHNHRDHAWRWSLVAAHMAAGARLRRALRSLASGEAILDVDGRLKHARGPAKAKDAREVLHGAVKNMLRARGRLGRSDPDEALQIWRALVAGRWSLVDSFDSDGRRFIVARRNDPKLEDPRKLTARERQVIGYAALGHSNKLIAYELGLGPTTVSAHLRSAMNKLGLRTRAELLQRMR